MRTPITTHDAGEPLFEDDLAPAPEARTSIRELHFLDDNGVSQGHRRFIVLEGMVITRRRHTISRDFALRNEQHVPTLNMRFCLQGEVSVRLPDGEGEARTRTGNHNIWYTPTLETTHALSKNDAHDVVEIYLKPDYFAALAERHPQLWEGELAPIAQQRPFRLHDEGATITPRMKRAIRQLLTSEAQGPLRQMLIEAKVTELLALQLQQHAQHEDRLYRKTDLSRREIDRMVEARDRALARLNDPPTLPELARQVGTNEFTLKRHFKKVFGTTVYGLLLDRKMERARTLLLDTNRLIGDIARELGYSHPAHFSTAFKKRYGASPSAFRKESSG